MTSPRVGLKQILAAKRVVRKAMAKRAARKYTYAWDKVMKEANGTYPKSKKIPPGFTGTNKQKFERALLYKNRIINHAIRNPKNYNNRIYRGVYGVEANQFRRNKEIHKKQLSSFSKNYYVAKRFAGRDGLVLMMNTKNKKLPSLNFTSGNFQSEFAPGGKYNERNEQEVLLPPGKFTVKATYMTANNLNPTNVYKVNFVANRPNTSHLHTHRRPGGVHSVNSKGRTIFKGAKGGLFKLTSSGKKKYLSVSDLFS
jgi:hypothetical protein